MDTRKLLVFMTLAKQMGYSDEEITNLFTVSALKRKAMQSQPRPLTKGAAGTQFLGKILGVPENVIGKVTQYFGQRSPYDVFSGGVNYGVDFGVGEGTPVQAPEGQWEVAESYGGARGKGRIGNKTNRGYGNSIVLKNIDTGEQIRLSHLAQPLVESGQRVKGGQRVGISGATGNVTGPHLDVEYKNKSGQLADVLRTAYAQQLFGK